MFQFSCFIYLGEFLFGVVGNLYEVSVAFYECLVHSGFVGHTCNNIEQYIPCHSMKSLLYSLYT